MFSPAVRHQCSVGNGSVVVSAKLSSVWRRRTHLSPCVEMPAVVVSCFDMLTSFGSSGRDGVGSSLVTVGYSRLPNHFNVGDGAGYIFSELSELLNIS
jgi:hypothetical protein